MIQEQAIVTGLDGDIAVIQMQRQSTCSRCELSSGCGTGAIGRLLGHHSKPLTIPNRHHLKLGDQIVLGMPDRAFLKAGLLIYGFPLVGLIGTGLLADWAFDKSEPLVFGFAMAGFIVGLISSDLIAGSQYSQQFDPKILKVDGEPKD